MKKLLISCAVLLVVSVLAWLALRAAGPEPVPLAAPTATAEAPHPPDAPRTSDRDLVTRPPRPTNEPNTASPTTIARPRPEVTSPEAVEVLVVDETAAIVPGADVRAWRVGAGGPVAAVRTRSDGRARMPLRPGDRLEAAADGYAQTRLVLADRPWESPVRIVLTRGTAILLARVVDDLGVPVSGARVRMSFAGSSVQGRSDGDGVLVLRSTAPYETKGQVEALVEVEHDDVCWPLEGIPIAIDLGSEEPRLLRTFRWAHLQLEALGPSGERLEGTTARLTHAPEDEETPVEGLLAVPGSAVVSLGSDPRGPTTLRISAPPFVELSLWVDHPTYRPAQVRVPLLEPGEERWLVHRFSGADVRSTLEVRLVDDADHPLAGTLTVSTATRSRVHKMSAGGVATIQLPDSDWRLIASAPGRGSVERRFVRSRPPAGPLVLILGPAERALEVQVARPGGTPLAGIPVRARPEDAQAASPLPTGSKTDEVGIARLEGLLPGRYRVMIGLGSPGLYLDGEHLEEVPHPAVVRGAAPGDRIRFELVAPSSLGGSVAGLGGRSLNWSWVDAATSSTPLFTVSTSPGDDGAFLVTGLPAGRYVAWPAGGSWSRPILEVELGVGEERRDLTAEIE